MGPRPLSRELAARGRGKQNPAIMDQALKAVRGNIQGRDIERIFVSRSRLGTLRPKSPVNLTLDIGQFCLRFRGSYPGTEGIKRVQALFILRGFTHPKEFPGRGQDGDEPSEYHGSQKNSVSPFVQKALLSAVKEGGSARMNGQ